MLQRISVILLPFVFTYQAFASGQYRGEIDTLEVWHVENGPRIIFPKIKNADLESTLEKYVLNLNADRRYQSVTQGDYALPAGRAETVPSKLQQLELAVIANRLSTQTNWVGSPADHLDQGFEEYGAQGYVIPLGLDALLTDVQVEEFHSLILSRFDLLVAAGGDDVDPNLYGEKQTFSKNTNRARDSMEIALIKRWINARKPVVGICRGQQIVAVALGYSLVQDIPASFPNLSVLHAGAEDATHPIDLNPVDNRNILFRILKKPRFEVSTRHHQAVNFKPKKGFIATGHTGIIPEAIQSEDETLLLMQFHPEITKAPIGPEIMKGIVRHFHALMESRNSKPESIKADYRIKLT